MVYQKVSNNFNNAIIYSLSSPHTDLIYIGSTCMDIKLRLRMHKELYKQYLKGTAKMTTALKLFELGEVNINLLEQCSDICCKKSLLKRERYHIETAMGNNKCVNKNIPSRTMKESCKAYYEKNADKIRDYYLMNRDKRIQYAKDYINNHKEQQKEYMKKHREKKKHIINAEINNIMLVNGASSSS